MSAAGGALGTAVTTGAIASGAGPGAGVWATFMPNGSNITNAPAANAATSTIPDSPSVDFFAMDGVAP